MTATTAHLDAAARKSSGAHYTPDELATFLAARMLHHAGKRSGPLRVLDPACGDGSLLGAFANLVPESDRNRLELTGYETDRQAISHAEIRLGRSGARRFKIHHGDFLEASLDAHAGSQAQSLFSPEPSTNEPRFDFVISNPPYVRTQVLGAERAQLLAEQFGLSGRVDLYHAFVVAMKAVLADRGILGLLTSNRFMLVQSGASMRSVLRKDFRLHELYDLGDTKLFAAAVLPAVLIAERHPGSLRAESCDFVRVYEKRNGTSRTRSKGRPYPTGLLGKICDGASGDLELKGMGYRVERGVLAETSTPDAPWVLSSGETDKLLATVQDRSSETFASVGTIRVGIKTTADKVFIRDDWFDMPARVRPEAELLRPLLTHHVADRWACAGEPTKRVIYPHETNPNGRKRAVDLSRYPKSRDYLEEHRDTLESRQYVIDAGRQWYEIWVPQNPADWERPKLVFPDIAERGRFFVDESGSIVNGDCYWVTLRDGYPHEWLYVMAAVGNSSFLEWYYDAVCHNKLYAGRRRFMTQYVKQFPLPPLSTPLADQIVNITRELVRAVCNGKDPDAAAEAEVDTLVWQAFGLSKPN